MSLGNDGVLEGPTWASGHSGGGLAFDGSDDLVVVGDAASLDLSGQLTLEAWVRPSSTKGKRAVLVKEGLLGPVYALHASGAGRRVSGAVETGGPVEVTGSRLGTGRWRHVALTYDGATLRLFVDGEVVGSRTTSGPVSASEGELHIGGTPFAGEHFAGVIDDVRVYARALSAAEIALDMDTPVGDGGSGGNRRPTAVIAAECTGLSCSFDGSGSNDDGTIVDHDWDLGDGGTASGPTVSHAYATGGTYEVHLSVTDDGGLTDVARLDLTVTASSEPIALTATGYKVRGVQHADLSWSGAAGAVDVYRDGAIVGTAGGSSYTDDIGGRGGGSYTYRVCESGDTSVCSDAVTVRF